MKTVKGKIQEAKERATMLRRPDPPSGKIVTMDDVVLEIIDILEQLEQETRYNWL